MKTKISEVDVFSRTNEITSVCEYLLLSLIKLLRSKGKGKANRRDNKAAKNRKRNSGEKSKTKSAFLTPLSHANSISKSCQMNN